MGLEPGCGAAGSAGWVFGLRSPWFGCWVIRTQHSRLLPYVCPKSGSWGTFPNAHSWGSRVQMSLGGKDLTVAGSQGP